MTQDRTKVIYDRFEDWANENFHRPDARPPFEHMLSIIYMGKLLDLFWFEGDVPEISSQEFRYSVNIHWPDQHMRTKDANALGNMSLGEMIFICERLREPDWLATSISFDGKLADSEFMKRWPLGTIS